MGMLHIYLREGNIDEIATRVREIEGIEFVEVHIGNSDIIGKVLYKYSKELLNITSHIRKTRTVEKLVWSEMIYRIYSKNNPFQFTKKVI